ncbi:DUF6165 family protein [Rhizobium sp. SL86]|uniref:DUF6165 family protein n=1 Tax=Rhizobium sp. SL86 TaxID=2995148 RepID=UPI002272DD7B|nr:DUF6165 family protein [Rhizobium sp. SL86]MCY1669374.1 DUF6165 family protein [Rhizobium sp. SL86]
MSEFVLVPVSIGELFDKISILEIKSERITDPEKLSNVRFELLKLRDLAEGLPQYRDEKLGQIYRRLKSVNEAIWDAENLVRQYNSDNPPDKTFIATAQETYKNNDHRAALKREINILFGSIIFEEKSHA